MRLLNKSDSLHNSPSGDGGKQYNMYYGAHPILFEKAEELRARMTKAEEFFWHAIKINEWHLKFRRQHPISIYITDFYCHAIKLVIEIDGGYHQHEAVKQNDLERENHIRSFGITVLRFSNEEILQNLPQTLITIGETIQLITESQLKQADPLHNSPKQDPDFLSGGNGESKTKLFVIKIGGNIIDDEIKLGSFLIELSKISGNTNKADFLHNSPSGNGVGTIKSDSLHNPPSGNGGDIIAADSLHNSPSGDGGVTVKADSLHNSLSGDAANKADSMHNSPSGDGGCTVKSDSMHNSPSGDGGNKDSLHNSPSGDGGISAGDSAANKADSMHNSPSGDGGNKADSLHNSPSGDGGVTVKADSLHNSLSGDAANKADSLHNSPSGVSAANKADSLHNSPSGDSAANKADSMHNSPSGVGGNKDSMHNSPSGDGGNKDSLHNSLLGDGGNMGSNIILIHGGGKIATKIGDQLGIESKYINGRRITDAAIIDLVTMVYGGLINKKIVAKLQALKCNAIGLTGADGNIIPADKRPLQNSPDNGGSIDYGFVGDINSSTINTTLLNVLLKENMIPVIAPLTHDGNGQLLNTNADTIASTIAIALAGLYDVRLIYCFEKKGILEDITDENSIIKFINKEKYQQLLADKKLFDGILPKIDNAFAAINNGVKEVLIGDAADLLQNTTENTIGTLIR